MFPIKSLLKRSLSVIIFNFEILSVILFTSSMERIVYSEVHTSRGKGKTFFFLQSSQNLQNQIFRKNRRGCCDFCFPIQSKIKLHGHFIKDALANNRQQIKINFHKVKSDYASFNTRRNPHADLTHANKWIKIDIWIYNASVKHNKF